MTTAGCCVCVCACVQKHDVDVVVDTDPRFYQEIRERGLNSNHVSTEEDELSPTEATEQDQNIVVKNYRAAYITWSQLYQVWNITNTPHTSAERACVCDGPFLFSGEGNGHSGHHHP